MSNVSIDVREINIDQIDTVIDLLCQRDERSHDLDSVRSILMNLEPSKLRAWVAYVGDDPAGFNSIYLRNINWQNRQLTAGYWAHLYVRPAYRKLMIYPRLIFSMLQTARQKGPEMIFTATRRPDVAAGHQKLGFQLIGTLPVRIKPLRPFRLLAKHWPIAQWAVGISPPLDALYSAYLALRRHASNSSLVTNELDVDSGDIDSLLQLISAESNGKVSQKWSAESLRQRFKCTIDGTRYLLRSARRGNDLVAVIISVATVRGNDIHTGVILDLLFKPTEQNAAFQLLFEAEQQIMHAGCEVLLCLNSMGKATSNIVQRMGFHKAPETYHMLVWPKELVPNGAWASNINNWRFTFADHDAF